MEQYIADMELDLSTVIQADMDIALKEAIATFNVYSLTHCLFSKAVGFFLIFITVSNSSLGFCVTYFLFYFFLYDTIEGNCFIKADF